MSEFFYFDKRLGINVPNLNLEWDLFQLDTQHSILYKWEQIRGAIPDRIADLEKTINMKQAQLQDETDFPSSCILNKEIAELASIINDLWIWYRTHDSSAEYEKILQ